MNHKSAMWRVYPTRPVRGFTHIYTQTRESAEAQKELMERYSGVKWAIEEPKED